MVVIVGIILRRMDHNVGMGLGVDRILTSSHIVGCVVHAENFVVINTIPHQGNGIAIIKGEYLIGGTLSKPGE